MLPLVAHGVDPADPAVVRVLTDHVGIRRLAADLEATEAADPAELKALGTMLDDHVRHEERVLFPMIEAALSDEELSALAQRVEDAERTG